MTIATTTTTTTSMLIGGELCFYSNCYLTVDVCVQRTYNVEMQRSYQRVSRLRWRFLSGGGTMMLGLTATDIVLKRLRTVSREYFGAILPNGYYNCSLHADLMVGTECWLEFITSDGVFPPGHYRGIIRSNSRH